MNVIWTKDQTTDPVTQTPATSGAVGGQCTIHLSFQEPAGFEGATVTGLVVHENANHYPDQDLSHTVVASQASPLCDGGNTGAWMYEDAHWASPGDHNSDHTITATMSYSWMTYVNGMPQGGSSTATTTITVTPGNLLITSTTPANPTPILWDPGTMTTVPLSANTSCAYKAIQPWTLKIYTSDQTLVKTYSGNLVMGPGTTTINQSWNGSSDTPGLYPDGATPPMAKGVYLFQWNVGVTGIGGDCDQDKSTFLSFGSPADSVTTLASDAGGQTVLLSQTLQDTNGIPPSACQVDVYQNWDLSDILTQTTPPALGTTSETIHYSPTSSAGPADIVSGASFIFLISPTDGESAHDKGHRDRVALQHNFNLRRVTLLTWGGIYPTNDGNMGGFDMKMPETETEANSANGLSSTLGYQLMSFRGQGQHEWGSSPTFTPVPSQIIYRSVQLANSSGGALNSGFCPNGVIAQCVDVAILCGHGAPGAFLFGFADSAADPLDATSDANNVSEVADADADLAQGAKYTVALSDLTAGLWSHIQYYNTPVSLVVWLGCADGNRGNHLNDSLPSVTVGHRGAACSAAPLGPWSLDKAQQFAERLAGEEMQNQAHGKTIYQGVMNATPR